MSWLHSLKTLFFHPFSLGWCHFPCCDRLLVSNRYMGFISSSIQLVCVLCLESWADLYLEFLLKVVCRLQSFWRFVNGLCLDVVYFSLNFTFVCFLFTVSLLHLFLSSAQSIYSCILLSTLFLEYEFLRMFGSYKNFFLLQLLQILLLNMAV